MEHERGLNPCIYWSKTRRYLLIPDEKRLVREVAVVLWVICPSGLLMTLFGS